MADAPVGDLGRVFDDRAGGIHHQDLRGDRLEVCPVMVRAFEYQDLHLLGLDPYLAEIGLVVCLSPPADDDHAHAVDAKLRHLPQVGGQTAVHRPRHQEITLEELFYNKGCLIRLVSGHALAAQSETDLRAFPYYNESWGVIKRTAITERVGLNFRAEFFNVFNRVVFAAPAANISNANFGRVSAQANNPRQGQVALKLEF